jgi:hypothetical protein
MTPYRLELKKGQQASLDVGQKVQIDLPSGKHVATVVAKQSANYYLITFDGIPLNPSL